jgi:UDP:flavonoid glycosyltransferase YjiC (YdhE family)
VRLLFTFAGGEGHLQPLLPLARAAAAREHEVVVSGAPSLAAAATGVEYVPSERDVLPQRVELRPYDPEQELRVVREAFAGTIARARAAELLALCEERRPDVVVRDEFDFGAAVAAERRGIPHVCVLVNASGGFVSAARVDAPGDALVLSPLPPSFRDPADPLPAAARTFRSFDAPAATPGERPLVYVTLGTIFNTESGDLLARIVRGVRELPVDVVTTVGRTLDPAELGLQPGNVRVERFVPQAELLPRCAAAVTHAGSGSVAGALAHGVPLVCVPIGADQPLNAARCAALGAGLSLDPLSLVPDGAGSAVAEVLEDPRYRRAAERLRDELAAQPPVDEAVGWIEALA